MPPKQRFTKEEVVAAALNLVRRDGKDRVTARGLGTELRCSSHPVFTVFQNMEEVKQAAALAARSVYNGYVEKGLAEEPAFKGVGMQYIRFAREEPKLFELLFMTPGGTVFTLDGILPVIDDNSDRILASIKELYGFSLKLSFKLYQTMWIFTHGIACLCATGMSRMTDEEAGALLTEVFTGQFIKLKSEEKGND